MAFFDDFKNAVSNYATNNCDIQILDFSIISGGGSILNVGDKFRFKARVRNSGPLDMKGVRLQAQATSLADVALDGGSFGASALSGSFNLDAGQSHTTGFFNGRAKAATPAATDIATVRISQWDASLDHILADNSSAGAAEGRVVRDIDPVPAT